MKFPRASRADSASRQGLARRRIRWPRVMTARARIAVGYYDRWDVREKVLEELLKELSRR